MGREADVTRTDTPSSAKVVRKAPQLTTLARSAVGNRNYQQDALYVSPSKILASNKKTRVLAVWRMAEGQAGLQSR